MKAQHRHELHTNALAERMGRLVHGIKQNPRSNTWIAWIIGIVGVVVALAWYFSSGAAGWSALWVKLDGETDPRELQTIAQAGPGTLPARTARFQQARLGLQQGLKGLYSPDREAAVKQLEEARKLYNELVPASTGEKLLTSEALVGAAKAEEALAAVPSAEKKGESVGDLDRALTLYKQAADEYGDTFWGATAAKHVEELEANKSQAVQFYSAIGREADAKKK
jgi:hypothetical protein